LLDRLSDSGSASRQFQTFSFFLFFEEKEEKTLRGKGNDKEKKIKTTFYSQNLNLPSHLFFGISQREETPKIMQKTNKTPVVLSAAKPQR
jgi:hypothetical protein